MMMMTIAIKRLLNWKIRGVEMMILTSISMLSTELRSSARFGGQNMKRIDTWRTRTHSQKSKRISFVHFTHLNWSTQVVLKCPPLANKERKLEGILSLTAFC